MRISGIIISLSENDNPTAWHIHNNPAIYADLDNNAASPSLRFDSREHALSYARRLIAAIETPSVIPNASENT